MTDLLDRPLVTDLDTAAIISLCTPSFDDSAWVRDWKMANMGAVLGELPRLETARTMGIGHFYGACYLAVIREGIVEDLGLVSLRVVTDVGCQKLVSLMNGTDAVTAANFKYHGLGTGTLAEATTDTALGTELTVEYATSNTRATGSQTTGTTTKAYRSVATNTLKSGTPAVSELGLFSAAAGGSLLDRFKFSPVNLVGANGDGIQSTVDFITVSGG